MESLNHAISRMYRQCKVNEANDRVRLENAKNEFWKRASGMRRGSTQWYLALTDVCIKYNYKERYLINFV